MRIKDVFGDYPFQIGHQEAWVLHDGFVWGQPIQQYAVGVPDPEIAALFELHSLDPKRIQLGLNPILFRWDNKLVLVDTGIGSVVEEPIGLLDKRLSALGIRSDDIEVVFLTTCISITSVGPWIAPTRKHASRGLVSSSHRPRLNSGRS